MLIDIVNNRLCQGGNGLHCYLCNVELSTKEDIQSHIKNDKKHLQVLKNFPVMKINESNCIELVANGIIVDDYKKYKCTFCTCIMSSRLNISEHISGKRHKSKRQKIVQNCNINDLIQINASDENNQNNQEIFENVPESYINDEEKPNLYSNISDQLQTCVSNDISEPNSSLIFCNQCRYNLKTDSDFRYHKMFHLSKKNHVTDIITFSFKENLKYICCLICDYDMVNETDLQNHLNSEVHLKRLILVRCPNHDVIMMNMLYLNSTLFQNLNIAPNNIYNTLNAEFNKYMYYLQQNIHQNISQTIVQNNHFSESISTSNNYYSQPPQTILQNVSSIVYFYFCFICDMKFTNENSLFLHYSYDHVHKYRIQAIMTILQDEYIKFECFDNNEIMTCSRCQIQLTELNGAMTHIFDFEHIYGKPINNQVIFNGLPFINNINVTKIAYSCSVCKINVTDDYLIVQHLTSDYHKYKMHEYYTNINNESYEKVIFSCSMCQMNFFNDHLFLQHFRMHDKLKFNSNITTNTTIYPNPNHMYLIQNHQSFVNISSVPAIQPNYVSYKNISSIPSNSLNYCNDTNQDKFNSMSNLNSNQNNNNTSKMSIQTKNHINFSSRYVKLCIEKGDENIFMLNIERIKKLQLGISLTFPYESNRCCIPCGCEVPSNLQLLYEHLRSDEHEENLQEMEDFDKYFENYRDQFSNLELAKSYLYEDSDEWVKCIACDINIENCKENLQIHINSECHINNFQTFKKSADEIINLFNDMFENLWYYIEKFFCHICCASFEYEVNYAKHLENNDHLKEVEKRVIKKQSFQFDYCILCSSYWYAKSDQHKFHCRTDPHRYRLKSRTFGVPKMSDSLKNVLTSVDKEINDLLLESDAASNADKLSVKKILESIEEVVRPKFAQAKAYLFGSRISYLNLKNSDLDIYLDCNHEYIENKTKKESEDLLCILQECFYQNQDIWKIMEIIEQARVPIIKLMHKSTNLICGISVISGLGVEKSKILSYFVTSYYPCRELILYVKKWIKISGLKNCINSFAISWFVIFYLQVKEILPSVQQLIKQKNNSRIVAGWETGVSENFPVEETNVSTKDLLQGFFSYYANFNYISDVTCPFLGKTLKKSQYSDIDSLPDEMNFYKMQIKEEKIEFFHLYSPMCIQDPIDLSQNITKAVTKLQLRMFKQYCSESAEILKTAN